MTCVSKSIGASAIASQQIAENAPQENISMVWMSGSGADCGPADSNPSRWQLRPAILANRWQIAMKSTGSRMETEPRPKVFIVGGGFAGIAAAKALSAAPVDVTLMDRRNHHVFQPLLYQVATASLSPADISSSIRAILRGQK